jgi:O-antigen ligase
MPPAVASLVFWAGIAGLIYLDRDKEDDASWAVWLSVVWIAIGASRALSQWMGADVGMIDSPEQYLDGSPVDRLFLTTVLVVALAVIAGRGARSGAVLRANLPLLVFFSYCAISVIWSDYPFVALKRWTKALGNLTMILILLTDRNPVGAIKRCLARLSYLLVPLSVLYIKYYPDLGRSYDRWVGTAYYNGIAVGKNSLGALCLICGLASVWLLLLAWRSPHRRMGRVVAHLVVLLMCLWLFQKAHSATSIACFMIGTALLLIATYSTHKARAVHLLVGASVSLAVVSLLFFDGFSAVTGALGRDATLTGRTELWTEILQMNPNPLIGTGFESFWLGPRAEYLWGKYWWHPNQSHNGYIEIYLNLGYLGFALLLGLFASGYLRISASLRRGSVTAPLMLALLVAGALYNFTEAAVKVMHPVWIALLLSVAGLSLHDRATDAVSDKRNGAPPPERRGRPQPAAVHRDGGAEPVRPGIRRHGVGSGVRGGHYEKAGPRHTMQTRQVFHRGDARLPRQRQ